MDSYTFKEDYTYQLNARTTINAKAGQTHPVPDDCAKVFKERGIVAVSVPPVPMIEKSIGNAPKDKSVSAPKNKAK